MPNWSLPTPHSPTHSNLKMARWLHLVQGAERSPDRLGVPSLPNKTVKAPPEVDIEELIDQGHWQTLPEHPHSTFGHAKTV